MRPVLPQNPGTQVALLQMVPLWISGVFPEYVAAFSGVFRPREAKIIAARGAKPPPTSAFTASILGCDTFQISYFKTFHIHYIIFLYIIAKNGGMHNRKMEKTEA